MVTRIVDAGAFMRKEMKAKHQAFFTQSETGEKFKRLQPQITDKPWFHQSAFNGEEVKFINRLPLLRQKMAISLREGVIRPV
jgi:hypothetical protein